MFFFCLFFFFISLFPTYFFWFFGDFIAYAPYHICFLVLPVHLLILVTLPLPNKKNKVQFVLSMYSLECAQTLSGLSLKHNWVLPCPQPSWKPSLVESDTSVFCHSFKEFSLVASSLGCCYYLYFEGAGWNGVKGCHRSLPCLSFSTFCLLSIISLKKMAPIGWQAVTLLGGMTLLE